MIDDTESRPKLKKSEDRGIRSGKWVLHSDTAGVKEDSSQRCGLEQWGPFSRTFPPSDFYVEPQMYLILYTETDLHTARMHESSCLSPISMVEMGE